MSNNWRADVHVHSKLSDGVLSVEQLLALADKEQIQAISITDHDSLAAYRLFYSQKISQKSSCKLITGIELSCQYRGVGVHLLGYRFSHNDPIMQSWEDHNMKIRRNRAHYYFDFWESNYGLRSSLREEFFSQHAEGVITRSHLANFFLQKNVIRYRGQFFRNNLTELCLTKNLAFPFLEEAIALLHAVGGYAVLAHPHTIPLNIVDSAFLKLPFDGVELFHRGKFCGKFWENWAQNRNLLTTAGSDFHDPAMGHVLGSSTVDAKLGFFLLGFHVLSGILELPYLSNFDHNMPVL